MRKILLASIMLTVLSSSMGQTPQSLNYQAVARNSTGEILQNKHVSIRFSIHDGSPSATITYQETDTATTNQFGLFTTLIGNGTVTVGTFTGIAWATGNKYLEVELDPAGGNSYNDMGTTQLVSVPYALYAQTAGNFASDSSGVNTHSIGDLYGGGIVVSVWEVDGVRHGLIASLVDLSTSSTWSNVTETIVTTAENQTNGSGNTTAIIAQMGQTSSAALLCQNYAGGGYSDWYLPAIWELQQCYNAAMIVNTVLGNANGFQFMVDYWSSTESPSLNAWCEEFNSGATFNIVKSSALSVRAVRRF